MTGDASSPLGAGVVGPSGGARVWRLAVIGLAAGFFSTVFGVGGGIVMVPLLLVLMRYEARLAAATSLAAIIFTSVAGTAAHGAFGNVRWDRAAFLGISAVGGLLVGLQVSRRVSNRTLTIAFGVFLVGVAVRLVLE